MAQKVFSKGFGLPTYSEWQAYVAQAMKMRINNRGEGITMCPICLKDIDFLHSEPLKIGTVIQTTKYTRTEIVKISIEEFNEVEFFDWERKVVNATVKGCSGCSLHVSTYMKFFKVEGSVVKGAKK